MTTIPGLVDKCLANGMNAVAVTDHGNMFGIKEFFDYADKKNAPSWRESWRRPVPISSSPSSAARHTWRGRPPLTRMAAV